MIEINMYNMADCMGDFSDDLCKIAPVGMVLEDKIKDA